MLGREQRARERALPGLCDPSLLLLGCEVSGSTPGYASTMARRSEILDIQKDQSTNLAQTFFTSVRYKKKFTHHTEEESRRPGSRQDSIWEGESNCEQLPNSAEKARGSLRAFRPFPLSHRLKMTSVDSSQTQERAV